MSNLSIRINLLRFKNYAVKSLTGKSGATKRCLIIPIEDNNLYEGEHCICADFIAFENSKLNNGKTHLIKQSLKKDIIEAMTDDEKKSMPLFGDVKPLVYTVKDDNSSEYEEPAASGSDDLPF